MKSKTTYVAGMILSLVVMITGIIVMFTPAETYSTSSVSYAAFGADYYTEQYAATRAVASNTAVTANNLRELGKKMALYVGLVFVFSGAYGELIYAKKYLDEKYKESVIEEENEVKTEVVQEA